MAQSDWTYLSNGLDTPGSVRAGVTNGIVRPSGGGNFCFGFNSVVNTPGAVALYTNQSGFNPATKGGSVPLTQSRIASLARP